MGIACLLLHNLLTYLHIYIFYLIFSSCFFIFHIYYYYKTEVIDGNWVMQLSPLPHMEQIHYVNTNN